MKILVADDDALTLKILTKLLTEQGHEPATFPDGQQALFEFKKAAYPVVISDWVMPLMTGVELAQTIRSLARESYTYFILLTSVEGKASYREAMDAGVDDFLRKPLDPDELMTRLRVAERILGLSGRVAQLEGILPICAYCKKIRNDAGDWVEVDRYIGGRTELSFSHGICVACQTAARAGLRKS
jgi:sigma-B regulation protein RsbU (phosphoserine phosphatase)